MPLVENKKFDHCIVVLGVRGSGKSTYALGRAVELGKTPAYVLALDPGMRLPEKLADGRPVAMQRHASILDGKRALASTPGGVHVFAVADGYEVLTLGKEVAAASLVQNGGTHVCPVVVLIDEGVLAQGLSQYRLEDEWKRDLAGLRHMNVGLIITAQDPRYIHYSVASLSTEIVLFRLNDSEAVKRAIRMGVSPKRAEAAARLPRYQFIAHDAWGDQFGETTEDDSEPAAS